MIKLESIHIEEVRGIRNLDLDFRKETFAISGPNGSGKSGVIDAIEFGLTGQIGRLSGKGTKALSVSEHGPHVDKTKFHDAAYVKLRLSLTSLGKSATITRKLKFPQKPKIDPSDDDVRAVLTEIAEHPEIALSRREILRFIIVEPSARSTEIQTILKLDDIGHTRNALNAAQNKLRSSQEDAAEKVQSYRQAIQRHLQIPTLRAEELLEAVNKQRKVLALPEITELTADTQLDTGLSSAAKAPEFNKESALRDLKAFTETVRGFPDLAKQEATSIVSDLTRLESDPALLAAFRQRSFIEKGLELVNGPECPLCDTPWHDEQHLRHHLQVKLAKSEEARKLQESLLQSGRVSAGKVLQVITSLMSIQKLAESQGEIGFVQLLGSWKSDLEALRTKFLTIEGLAGLKARLTGDWLEIPKTLADNLNSLRDKINAKPDQTATLAAQTFLTTAQLRLGDWRTEMRRKKAADAAYALAKAAYDTYCTVLEDELNTLYEEVQKDFSTFYRALNEEDEAKFTAKLTPSQGKLALDVNFYERGLFPPGAYHSEGHQDGMGVCLYLALMKRLFGERFTFALLDDVVMSVDAGHRYQFCRLLKTYFPNTQFIITTHDRLWAEQMKSAGLVTGKSSIAFHSWSIDAGPLVESNQEIWNVLDTAIAMGNVEAAAAALRRHLEYASRHLADHIGATPQFRADGNYELGELLPSVLSRMKSLYSKAADAAQSWGNDADKDTAVRRKDSLSNSAGAYGVEQWAINKAVHYNEWANFGRKDFEPVVAAFKELLECFRCVTCSSWLYITPRGNPETLRCACNSINLNLKPKPKSASSKT